MTGKAFKIIVFVLLGILAAVVLALVVFASANGYSFKYMMTRIFPGTVENVYKPYSIVEFETQPGAMVAGGGGYVYILDGHNLTVYSGKGTEKTSLLLDMQDPVLSGGDKGAVVYDRTSGDYIVFKEGLDEYTESLGKSILGASMQDNGFIIFILKGGEGFLGSAVVMDDENNIIATCMYSDRYPVSGCVVGDSGRFAISGIFGNDPESTGIDVYEFYKDSPSAGYSRGTMVPLVIGSDRAFTAVGSDYAVVISGSGEEAGFSNYNQIVRAASNGNGAFITDRKSGVDRIAFLDDNGDSVWEYSTGLLTEGVTAGGRHVFYWSGITAACLDGEGRPVAMQGGFEVVRGIAELDEGRISVVTSGSIIFYEYR